MGQAPSRDHEANPQSGLGVGCKVFSSSKKLRGVSVRAQARRISISLSFSVAGVSLAESQNHPSAVRTCAPTGIAAVSDEFSAIAGLYSG